MAAEQVQNRTLIASYTVNRFTMYTVSQKGGHYTLVVKSVNFV